MERGQSSNWYIIIYRKEVIHMTEIERLFLAAQSFNTNLVQCLPPYFVIISNMHVCCFMCTISHVHMHAPKMVLHTQNLLYKKIMIYEDLLWFLFLKPQTTVQLYILGYYSRVRIGLNMNNKCHTLPIVYMMLV